VAHNLRKAQLGLSSIQLLLSHAHLAGRLTGLYHLNHCSMCDLIYPHLFVSLPRLLTGGPVQLHVLDMLAHAECRV